MLSDLALKVAVVFMLLFGSFYMWYFSKGNETLKEEFREGVVGKLPVDIPTLLQESGLGARAYCPYINPYMSQLFSAGSLEVGPGHPLHGALEQAMGSDCKGRISATFDYDSEQYELECGDSSVQMSTDQLAGKLNTYVASLGGTYLKEKIPLWQCFAFFGFLPFVAMALFLRDILWFTMLSRKVKLLVVVFSSVLAVITGGFAMFVWQLAYLASMSVQATFIVVMLVLAFSSVLMSWIGSINLARAEARKEAAQMAAGLAQKYTFGELGDIFGKKE